MSRRAKRVTLIHYTTPAILGGVEQVMGKHAAGLDAAGASVTVVAGRGGAPRGVTVARVRDADSRSPAVERNTAALRRGQRTAEHERLVKRLVAAIGAHVAKADRVVVHNVLTMPLNLALTEALARLASEYPARFIAWTHDIAHFDPRYDTFRHEGEPWSLITRALPNVRYVTVSVERADQLAELTGLPRADISVVTNGIDVFEALGLGADGTALARRLKLEDAEPLLLLPVRITPRKRIEAAIDATAALRTRGYSPMLVVTGGVGPHDVRNRAYLADLKRRARRVKGVHLLAALGVTAEYPTVVDLYALADVLVFPSQSEGFGLPMLEAGLHRMPIVCSDIPALRETGGDDPIYVRADASGEVIADAIERALDSPVMGMRRRSLAHSWTRVLRERVVPVILDDAP